MNCCVECFQDTLVRGLIEKSGASGDCDFCKRQGVIIYSIGTNSEIEDMLNAVLDLYSTDAPENLGKSLYDALMNDWDIFSDVSSLPELIAALCGDRFDKCTELKTSMVWIPQLHDEDVLRVDGVLHGYNWLKFSEEIKTVNRFHNALFNADVFASFLSYFAKAYPVGTTMYRARICPTKEGFIPEEMGAPPYEFRRAGRINPEGICALYLSSDIDTCLNETRAGTFDFISVGTFVAQKEIKIVNLSGIASASPFIDLDKLAQHAINRHIFQDIAKEIAKPLRRGDSPLEYLPTQYVSEFIKSAKFSGVEYESTMHSGGYNLAIFDESLFRCVETTVMEVTAINYQAEQVR